MAFEDNTTPLNVLGQVIDGMDVVSELAIDDIITMITITEYTDLRSSVLPLAGAQVPANGAGVKTMGAIEHQQIRFGGMGW